MEYPEVLRIEFSGGVAQKPRVLIRIDDRRCEIRTERWIHFLSLLAYRRLTQPMGGWVTLDDVRRLVRFSKLPLHSIGKYLLSHSTDLPSPFESFLSRHLELNTHGPYALYLQPDQIKTNSALLEQFIAWAYVPKSSEDRNWDFQWETVDTALSSFEYTSAQHALTNLIASEENSDPNTRLSVAWAYIYLCRIELECGRNPAMLTTATSRALELIRSLPNTHEKNLLASYIAAIQALSKAGADGFESQVQTHITESIQILAKVPIASSDKLTLLGGRYYQRAYEKTRRGDQAAAADDFKLSQKFYSRLKDTDEPRKILHDSGILEGSTLQYGIIRRVVEAEAASDEDLMDYAALLCDPTVSRLLMVNVATWIAKSFIQAGQLDQALEFVRDSIRRYTLLHDTLHYRSLIGMENDLLHRLGQDTKPQK